MVESRFHSWLGARVPAGRCALLYARPLVPQQGCGLRISMFGGGGFLGVGTQEVLVIAAVGWFVLGPQKLFALSKDIGRIVGELRKTAAEARETFTDAMESDMLELENTQSTANGQGAEHSGNASLGSRSSNGPATEETHEGEVDQPLPTVAESDYAAVKVSTEEADETRRNFLDQLQRVADPEQTAPSEVPDLDIDDEVEIARLERQLLAARERLAQKRAETKTVSVEPPPAPPTTAPVDETGGSES